MAYCSVSWEGPNSPIESILAGETGRPNGGANGTPAGDKKLIGEIGPNGSPKGSLADRIRALQNRRVSQAS